MRDARSSALITALLAVMVLEVLHLFTGLSQARAAAHLAMIVVVPLAAPHLGLREAYLLVLSMALSMLLWQLHPDPWPAAQRALDQAAFLMAFVLLISLVQEAAMTSRSVTEVGMYLARQPGGRRYTGLHGGTMLMAVVFNLSTVTLLAPLIKRSSDEARDDPLTPVRERRQLNALLRGFAWSVIWSPTAVAPLALYGLIDGIDRGRWMMLGFLLSLIMLFIGWAEDRIHWHRHTASVLGLPPVVRAPLPMRSVKRFALVSLCFAVLTGGVMLATGLGTPPSLMVAAPVLLVGWLWAQGTNVPDRLRQIASDGLPASAPIGVTLACSGFVGISGAALIPAETAAEWIGLEHFPAWLFLLSTTLAVTLLSQFALSPIMMAVFFGAVLGALPSLPADPTLTALAIAAGWSVSTTISPFASGVIMLSRITGHRGVRLTYRWNTVFTGLSIVMLAGAYWVLAG